MEKDLIKSENKLAANYHRTTMQKEMVLQSLKENGCRITKQRKNMYRISCGMNCDREGICIVELDDQSICRLSSGEWYNVISEGLRCLGYAGTQKVASVVVEPCDMEWK